MEIAVASAKIGDEDCENRVYDAPGRSKYVPGQQKKQTRYYDEWTGSYYYK